MWPLTLFTLLSLGWIVTVQVHGLPPSNLNNNNNQRHLLGQPIVQTPAQDRSFGEKFWGKKKQPAEEGPSYAINPNFGFRSYHQIRYEPMTVPFDYSEPPAQIPPVDYGYPVPMDPAYDQGNDYRALPPYENANGYESVNSYAGEFDVRSPSSGQPPFSSPFFHL